MFDEKHFNEIYESNAKAVFRYCLVRLSGDRAAAEEATSDTFMTLFRKWDQLDLDDNISAWLIRSAEWCIKHQKHKYGNYYGKVVPIDDSAERNLHDPLSDVEGALEAQELAERIEKALPSNYAMLFRLRYIEGLTIADTARRLNEPYANVRLRCARLERSLDVIREKIKCGKF